MNTAQPPLIIGLGSRARVGKDTAWRIIKRHYPHAIRRAFADPLKERLLGTLAPMDLNPFTEDPAQKALIRPLLVELGRLGRALRPDYWVEVLFDSILDDARIVVITDVRYANEAAAIQRRGGWVWEITRPGVECANAEEAEHSAQVSDMADTRIDNDGTEAYFERQILSRLEAVKPFMRSSIASLTHAAAAR